MPSLVEIPLAVSDISEVKDFEDMLHHIATILNQKWPPKYKNLPIWAKFCFQVDFDIGN
jgi:hypothetical protein